MNKHQELVDRAKDALKDILSESEQKIICDLLESAIKELIKKEKEKKREEKEKEEYVPITEKECAYIQSYYKNTFELARSMNRYISREVKK